AHFVCARYVTQPNIEDIKACREAVGPKFGIKAGEEILDTKTALALISAGATRLSADNGAYPLSSSRSTRVPRVLFGVPPKSIDTYLHLNFVFCPFPAL